jgi:hypothetical protein
MLVELGTVEAFIAGEAATKNVVHGDDFSAAAFGNGRKLVDRAHLTHAAHRMNDNRIILALDRDARQNAIVNELDAVVHWQPPVAISPHSIGARTCVEYDRPASVFTRLAQGDFQFRCLRSAAAKKPLLSNGCPQQSCERLSA